MVCRITVFWSECLGWFAESLVFWGKGLGWFPESLFSAVKVWCAEYLCSGMKVWVDVLNSCFLG